MKRFIFFIVIFGAFFTFSASAETDSATYEMYDRQYEASGTENLKDIIPEDTLKILKELGVDPANPEGLINVDNKNIFKVIWDFFITGGAAPIKSTFAIIGMLVIFASVDGLIEGQSGSTVVTFICFAGGLALLQPVYGLIDSVQDAIKGLSTFMLAFLPIYGGVVAASGNAALSGSFSSLLLWATEGISQFISTIFLPVSKGCMCLGICGGISPVPLSMRLAEWIKKSAIWIMGIATTLFLGVLSFQTAISVGADSLGIRTGKAVLSTTIPVMGPAIAETVNTARGCLTLLRSGVGIYGAAAVLIMALPVAIELALWRLSMWVSAGVAETLSLPKSAMIFRSVDFALAVLLGAVCFTVLLFVISLGIAMGK